MGRVNSSFHYRGIGRILLPSVAFLFNVATIAALETAERANLPRQWMTTDVNSPGRIIRVDAGGDFQEALKQANPGDIIELEAGASFRGPFILPRKPEASKLDPAALDPAAKALWITIRSAPRGAELPPAGVRVSPADAAAMARLETRSGAVVATAPGAHHYKFIGIEFTVGKGRRNSHGDVFLDTLLRLGENGISATETSHHIIIERCYLHGDPRVGTRRGIVMNSAATAVVDSYLADFKMRGEDSQAIIGWAGPGPYRIHNNYLEAAGENLMFGGGDPVVQGQVPADIEIRGNHFAKPLVWRAGSSGETKTHSTDSSLADFAKDFSEDSGWTVKNLFELKNARRVLVDGNLFEYNWPESQNGFAILLTVRNQDGSAPWSVVEDITFSNNIVRHVANGINILGRDDNYPSQQTRRLVIRNNLFDDVGGVWGGGDLFQLLDGTASVIIEHNSAFHTGKILIGEGRPHRGFVFRNNIVHHNQYGIVGTDSAPGAPVLTRYFPEAVMQKNLIVGGSRRDYPAGNTFPSSIKAIGSAGPTKGDFRPQAATERHAGIDFMELCRALSPSELPVYCATGEEARP